MPVFAVDETSRTVDAVDYQHRGGATNVDLAGTALLPSADGKAKVRSKRGTMEVEAEFGNLQGPTTFGAEYLTYVLWAISPDGHAVNLGEVLIGDNDRSKLTATTDLQAFALIVTAEPYFAVRQPSNVVVLENVIRADTKGTCRGSDMQNMNSWSGAAISRLDTSSTPWFWMPGCPWSSWKRGTQFALPNLREPSSTPVKVISTPSS